MAITKQRKFISYKFNVEYKTIEVEFITVFLENGEVVGRGQRESETFNPNQIEVLKTFTGLGNTNEYIQHFNSIWDQAAKDKFNQTYGGQ